MTNLNIKIKIDFIFNETYIMNMELEFNYNDIHDILDIKFTKKQNELISKILQHFLLNDVLNENFNEIKKIIKVNGMEEQFVLYNIIKV